METPCDAWLLLKRTALDCNDGDDLEKYDRTARALISAAWSTRAQRHAARWVRDMIRVVRLGRDAGADVGEDLIVMARWWERITTVSLIEPPPAGMPGYESWRGYWLKLTDTERSILAAFEVDYEVDLPTLHKRVWNKPYAPGRRGHIDKAIHQLNVKLSGGRYPLSIHVCARGEVEAHHVLLYNPLIQKLPS